MIAKSTQLFSFKKMYIKQKNNQNFFQKEDLNNNTIGFLLNFLSVFIQIQLNC